jgi:hypothetical protein
MRSGPIPYREGDKPPSENHVLVQLQDENGNIQEGKFWVDAREEKASSIAHENVNQFLPMLRWQWRHLQRFADHCRSFEDWELGFLRDKHPEKEIELWTAVTYAFLEFTNQNPRVKREGIYTALLLLINGQGDRIDPPTLVPKLKKLMDCPRSLLEIGNFTEDGHFTKGPKHLR